MQSRVLGGVNQDLRAGGTPKDPQSTPSATSGPPGLSKGPCQLPPSWPRSRLLQRKLKFYLWQLICVPSASREETSGGHMPSPRRQMPHSVSGFLPHETEGTAILGLLSFSKEAPNPHFYVCNPGFSMLQKSSIFLNPTLRVVPFWPTITRWCPPGWAGGCPQTPEDPHRRQGETEGDPPSLFSDQTGFGESNGFHVGL